MLGLGKTGTLRASATASSAPCRDIYQRYAATMFRQALYGQALLTLDDPAPAEHFVGDAIVNECALALVPERGQDDARQSDMATLLRAVLRKLSRTRQIAGGK
jgi:hypothetical protein